MGFLIFSTSSIMLCTIYVPLGVAGLGIDVSSSINQALDTLVESHFSSKVKWCYLKHVFGFGIRWKQDTFFSNSMSCTTEKPQRKCKKIKEKEFVWLVWFGHKIKDLSVLVETVDSHMSVCVTVCACARTCETTQNHAKLGIYLHDRYLG